MLLYCIVRTETVTHVCTRLKSHLGVSWSRNRGLGIHATHCFKNYVQRAKLTVFKVFQNDCFLFLGFDWHMNSMHVVCVLCSSGSNVKTDQMEYLDPTLLIGAPMQPDPHFLSFTVVEQRGGTTFTIYIETFSIAISCFVSFCLYRDGDTRFTRLKSHLEVNLSRCREWGLHSTHCFKNSVQSAKLTVLKVFQDVFYYGKTQFSSLDNKNKIFCMCTYSGNHDNKFLKVVFCN